MSHSPSAASKPLMAAMLALLVGAMFVASRHLAAAPGRESALAALGFFLLAGTLASELLEALRLPHLTAYLLVGVAAGPHALNLVDHRTVDDLAFVNSLALALIALAGGAELRLEVLRSELRSVLVANAVHASLGMAAMTVVFFLARPLIPFVAGFPPAATFGVALLWGAIAVSRSPSATLALLSQTRARGPLTNNVLAFIMLSDVVIAVLFAVALMVARPLIDPTASLSLRELRELGHELLGSVAVGTAMGLLLAAYMRLVGAQLQLVLLALGFVVWEALRYLRFDALLTFLVAGFVVQNLSRQGPRFLRAIEQMSRVVFVLFFTTAGAHLDLHLLATLWPVALLLATSRALFSVAGSRLAGHLAGDAPVVRRWGWSSLISQAGLTLGLVVLVERVFPSFGTSFRALGVATVAINEVVGPVLFKMGLDRAGETSREPAPVRSSHPAHDEM